MVRRSNSGAEFDGGNRLRTTPDTPEAAYAQGLRDAAAMLNVDRQTIRLRAGEMTAQEMRVVLAVLAWKRSEMVERAAVVVAMGRGRARSVRTSYGDPSQEP